MTFITAVGPGVGGTSERVVGWRWLGWPSLNREPADRDRSALASCSTLAMLGDGASGSVIRTKLWSAQLKDPTADGKAGLLPTSKSRSGARREAAAVGSHGEVDAISQKTGRHAKRQGQFSTVSRWGLARRFRVGMRYFAPWKRPPTAGTTEVGGFAQPERDGEQNQSEGDSGDHGPRSSV